MSKTNEWLDYPDGAGLYLWNGDQSDGELLYVVCNGDGYKISDDETLSEKLGRELEEGENFWEMTPCEEMNNGQWKKYSRP
jgi:hypothetical protein